MTEPKIQEALRERYRCYDCYRSLEACFCDRIPTINNRTHVLLLQHMRERTHPFNTARILRKSLANSHLLVDHNQRLAESMANMPLSPSAGFLYPGDDAILLDGLSDSQKPDQLVVIDGTWHHTKTMLRDIPRLRSLPRYRLAPCEPSRYGIRREPNAMFLSTLEATVASLRCLEPETLGFDRLLDAFELMVHRQQAHPKAEYGWRKNHRHGEKPLRVPDAIRSRLESVVVVYAETASESNLQNAQSPNTYPLEHQRKPIYWLAQRLVSGERFERAIAMDKPPSDTLLQHLELSHNAFDTAISSESLAIEWQDFLRPDDVIVFYHSHVRELLSQMNDASHENVYLRGIQFKKQQKNGTLEQLLATLQITPCHPTQSGRAGKRLASTIALVEHLFNLSLTANPTMP